MNKSTINSLLLTFGIIILIIGLVQFWLNNSSGKINIWIMVLLFSGIFIISKTLRKTKELPSRAYKERLKKKD